MAFTQADVEALERAIAEGRGAKTITFGDQSVTFQSIAEMLELRNTMLGIAVAEADVAAGTDQDQICGDE